MKHIFLHIGTEKTGSTSIQKFIQDNRVELLERNIYVPTTGLESRHHFNIARSLGFSSSSELDSRDRHRLLKQLDEELQSCRQDNILITSEHFDINASADASANLASFFREFRLSVIMVLRNQIDYAKSLYIEYIKWGGILQFDEYMRASIRNGVFNYLARYRVWSNICDAVEVIDYDLHKTNLIEAFSVEAKLGKGLNFVEAEKTKTNESPSADFMEFVRQMNVCIPREERRKNYLFLLESFRQNSPELLRKHAWGFSQPRGFTEFLAATKMQNDTLAGLLHVSKKTFLGGSVVDKYKKISRLDTPCMANVVNSLCHANGQAVGRRS